MDIFLTICDLLIPAVMILIGILFRSRPPKAINMLYGYRTSRSMSSQAAWDFAHAYYAKVVLKVAPVVLLFSVAVIGLCLTGVMPFEYTSLGLLAVQLAALIATIPPVEKELEKCFDKDGKPKENTPA